MHATGRVSWLWGDGWRRTDDVRPAFLAHRRAGHPVLLGRSFFNRDAEENQPMKPTAFAPLEPE
jgi:hypothetical protein